MVYGETLTRLNPCDPQMIAHLLGLLVGPGAHVADVGCGRGVTLAWLSKHTGYALFGAEPERGLYDEAHENCPEAVIARAAADDLPFADQGFDAVLMECVFSLLDSPEAAAKEISRITRRQGALLLTDLFTQAEEDIDVEKSDLLRYIYTKQSVETFFENSGFVLDQFIDRTADIQTMIAQMIMDGAGGDFLSDETRRLLRQAKAGYGIWIFQKR